MRTMIVALGILASAIPSSDSHAQERFTSFDQAASWLDERVPRSSAWALVSGSDQRLMSVNHESMKVGDFPIIQFWMRDDLIEPQDLAGTPYQSMKALVKVHCFEDRVQTLAAVFHPNLGGQGVPIFSSQEPTEWSFLIPDTTLKGASDWACRYSQRLLDDPAGTLIDPLGET